MSPMQALVGFTAWTLFLVILVFAWRGYAILLGGRRADSWTRGKVVDNDPAVMARIQNAHLNCLENLPIFAVIVLAAAALNKNSIVAPYAAYVLYARVAQSLVHIIAVNHWMVFPRATFWAIQLALFVIMLWDLLHA